MKLYLSGWEAHKSLLPDESLWSPKVKHVLSTYFYNKKAEVYRGWMNEGRMIFIDSGAFTAHTQGHPINIRQYVEFLQKVQVMVETYAALDVIGSWEDSLKNLKIMTGEGLIHALPCYHYGEPLSLLEKYLQEKKYVGLGGMVGLSRTQVRYWLDDIFHRHNNEETCLFHGYGVTSEEVLMEYPWYSVDSGSWFAGGKFGRVAIAGRIIGFGSNQDKEGLWSSIPSRDQEFYKQKCIEEYGITVDDLISSNKMRNLAGALRLLNLEKQVNAKGKITFQKDQLELFGVEEATKYHMEKK